MQNAIIRYDINKSQQLANPNHVALYYINSLFSNISRIIVRMAEKNLIPSRKFKKSDEMPHNSCFLHH